MSLKKNNASKIYIDTAFITHNFKTRCYVYVVVCLRTSSLLCCSFSGFSYEVTYVRYEYK
jgi:hypothetical protein